MDRLIFTKNGEFTIELSYLFCFGYISFEKMVEEYIKTRLKLVNCREDLFEKEAYHTFYTLMQGSVRNLNQLINKSLIIGQHKEKETIGSEIIMESSEEAILK